MIATENMIINGKAFVKTYSDDGYMVERDGVRYDEAIDPAALDRQYAETDILRTDLEITDAEALEILLGGAV